MASCEKCTPVGAFVATSLASVAATKAVALASDSVSFVASTVASTSEAVESASLLVSVSEAASELVSEDAVVASEEPAASVSIWTVCEVAFSCTVSTWSAKALFVVPKKNPVTTSAIKMDVANRPRHAPRLLPSVIATPSTKLSKTIKLA